jgi:hypothetical protein
MPTMLAAVFVVNPGFYLIGGLIFATLSFVRASAFRNRWNGQHPWVHPAVWAVIGFLFGLLGFALCLIACATSGKRAAAALQNQGAAGYFGAESPGYFGSGTDPTVQGSAALAGWHPDPSGRHQLRYWSGTEWTDQVTDNGVPSTDPPT